MKKKTVAKPKAKPAVVPPKKPVKKSGLRKVAETKKEVKPPRKKKMQTPRMFKFTGLDKQQYSLTFQQKLFAEYFLNFDGNGTDAIIEAGYNCNYPNSSTPNRQLAAVMASQNLIKVNISKYIELMFEDVGLNDAIVDKHLLFNVTQFSDLSAKNKAIDMYNKRKGRYAAEKVDHTTKGKALPQVVGFTFVTPDKVDDRNTADNQTNT